MILVIGNLSWERMVEIDRLPLPNEDVLIKRSEKCPGGAAGNVAATLGLLGQPVSLVASVGNDDQGHALVREIETYGVNTSHIRFCNVPTSEFLVTIDARGNRCFYLNPAEAAFQLRSEIVEELDLSDISGIALVGCKLDLAKRVIEAIGTKSTTTTVFANIGFWIARGELGIDASDFLSHIKCLFANLTELRMLTQDTLQYLMSQTFLGVSRQLVVTDGDKDAMVYTSTGPISVPALRIEHIENTLGCGDAFMGGYIAGYARGLSPRDCCEFGHRCAGKIAMLPCERSPALRLK